jgi:hypothetical protein
MITQYQVPSYLAQTFPVFRFQPQLGSLELNIYQELQQFTEYTKTAIDDHDYTLAKRCFRLAGKLYEQGDTIVKNAIENIFVFSFSAFFTSHSADKVILKSFVPSTLYALYIKQVTNGGC